MEPNYHIYKIMTDAGIDPAKQNDIAASIPSDVSINTTMDLENYLNATNQSIVNINVPQTPNQMSDAASDLLRKQTQEQLLQQAQAAQDAIAAIDSQVYVGEAAVDAASKRMIYEKQQQEALANIQAIELQKQAEAQEAAKKAQEAAAAQAQAEAQAKAYAEAIAKVQAEAQAQEAAKIQAAAVAQAKAEAQAKAQAEAQALAQASIASSLIPGATIRNSIATFAGQFNGGKYVFGGENLATGVDCSGFVQQVYKQFGFNLPHSSSAMRSVGQPVELEQIQPGDIVCYSGHVALYSGNGQLIEASSPQNGIKYTPITAKDKPILDIRRVV